MSERIKIIGNYYKDGVVCKDTTLVISNIVERLQTTVKIDMEECHNVDSYIFMGKNDNTFINDSLYTKIYIADTNDNEYYVYIKNVKAYIMNDAGETVDTIKGIK